MRNVTFIITAALLVILSASVQASVRSDLSDRTPEEVVQKSLSLASQGDYSKVTGFVFIPKDDSGMGMLGTGIALDPYTVLTAAHVGCFKKNKLIHFILCTDVKERTQENTYPISSAAIIHPDFKMRDDVPSLNLDKIDGQFYAHGLPFNHLSSLGFEAFENLFGRYIKSAHVDLCILKLDVPLSDKVTFPEILEKNFAVKESYGISLGYGQMQYNDPEGPTKTDIDMQRHLISSKVSSCHSGGGVHILAGNYKGKLVNGGESFIPDTTMRKTEGLPVRGDSGGPFFIEVDGTYKLSGIASIGAYLYSPTQGDLRKVYEGYTQPIFPIWIDIRKYVDWISSHIGETKLEL